MRETPVGKVRLRVRISFALLAGFLLCLTLLYRFVGDRTALGEYLTIWPSFFWLFPLAPFVVFVWERKAPAYLLALVAVSGSFLLLTAEWRSLLRWPAAEKPAGLRELREAAADDGSAAIRLVTWNISGGAGGMDRLLGKLKPLRPDICLFQESPDFAPHELPVENGGFFSDWQWHDAGDCAILSRHPFTSLLSVPVGPWSAPQLVVVDLPTSRRLLVANARLMLPSLVVNPLLPGNWERLTAGHRTRVAQFQKLLELLRSNIERLKPDAVVLAGDFNTPGTAKSLEPLRGVPLRDAWAVAGSGWGATMTEDFPVSRIDQCWVSPGVRVVRASVVSGAPSDHRCLVVDFVVR